MIKVVLTNGKYVYGTEIRYTWDCRKLLISFNGEFEEEIDPFTIQKIVTV